MRKTVLLLACIFAQFAVKTSAQSDSKNLTDAEKAYVLSKFCTEVKYNYVFYNDLAFNWDSLCVAALPTLLATETFDEYTDELKRLCAKLSDGHTLIDKSLNHGSSENWIRPLPMKTKRIGDKVFVTEVFSSDFKEKGVDRGCEILKIDGLNVIDYVNKYKRPYFSSSTPQWLDYAPYFDFALTKDNGSKVSKVVLRNSKGKTITIESHRNINWDLQSSRFSEFDYKVLSGNVGLLKISSFMSNNFTREFDEIYKEIEKTDALIIDLRDNGGGNSYYADYITSHLSDRPIKKGKWSSRMYIAAHGSWNYSQEWFMESPKDLTPINGKSRYTKPVVLLVNSTTFSSAENFTVTFRGMNRGKIIGTPTGGSTGNPISIDLGHGIVARICTKNEWDVAGNEFIGKGIFPDIEVEETEDIFLKEKDVVVERALKELGK